MSTVHSTTGTTNPMTKKEALHCLATSIQRCQHEDKSEVVYRRRMYPICKSCFAATVAAFRTVGEFSRDDTRDALYAYTLHASPFGYQAEIFYVEDFSTVWSSGWFTTKQDASSAARSYLRVLRRPTVERLIAGISI